MTKPKYTGEITRVYIYTHKPETGTNIRPNKLGLNSQL